MGSLPIWLQKKTTGSVIVPLVAVVTGATTLTRAGYQLDKITFISSNAAIITVSIGTSALGTDVLNNYEINEAAVNGGITSLESSFLNSQLAITLYFTCSAAVDNIYLRYETYK